MNTQIYFYKDGDEYISFSLSKERGIDWTWFCFRLGHTPTLDDYIKFLMETEKHPVKDASK